MKSAEHKIHMFAMKIQFVYYANTSRTAAGMAAETENVDFILVIPIKNTY